MSDPHADCTTSKGRKRSYAAVVENGSSCLDKKGPVVVGQCVSESAISRSRLLSGIEGTEGLASLPRQISSDEVKLWMTAYVVDVKLPPQDLVTILKVADALDDADKSRWVRKLADTAMDTDWEQDATDGSGMLCSLLCLTPHLLAEVLSTCLKLKPLSTMLPAFPPPLHPAITSASVVNGTLKFTHAAATDLLTHLPTIAVPTPGLLNLSLEEVCANTCMPPLSPPAAGAQLARALAAHPSLTSLSLGDLPLTPQWLRAFSSCLAPGGLRHIASLRMSMNSHPRSCAELAACLAALPALTALSATMNRGPSASTAESLSSYTSLTAGRVSLPFLKDLALLEGSVYHNRRRDGLRCPALGYSTHDSCAHSILSILTAPALTSLDILSRTANRPLQPIISQVSRFTSLQRLHLTTKPLDSDVAASRRAAAAAAATLPSLASIAIDSICSASAVTLAVSIIPMACASLTSLCVSIDESYRGYPRDKLVTYPPRISADVWVHFCSALQRCTGLQNLGLDCLPGIPRISGTTFTDGLAQAVVCLTQLKRLSFAAEPDAGPVLDGQLLGTALSKLTRLDDLTIDPFGGIRFDSVEPVIAACAHLTQLTCINMLFEQLTAAHINNLLSGLCALQSYKMSYSVFDENRAAVAALQARETEEKAVGTQLYTIL